KQLQKALQLLDEDSLPAARRAALKLQEKGYQDPDFPGGVAFVLGMCAFHDATAFDDVARDRRYLTAASYLQEAERLSLPAERRPVWSFAAGISLYRVGQADEALPILEEAIRSYPPGKHEAGLILTQIYMDGRTKHNMEQALELNTVLVEDAALR